MSNLKIYDYLYFFSLSIVVFIFINYIRLNVDSLWILHCAKQIIDGATLYVDKIDVNPPLIFIYSIIPVMFSKITSISMENSYILFVLVLVFLSTFLCFKIIKDIYKENENRILIYSIFFILTISTTSNFGEREHLFVIFVFPYILYHLYKEQIFISNGFLIFIAIFAALGFNLKPHFFIVFVFLEFYFFFKSKRFSSFFRIDTIIIALSGIFYLLIIKLFFEEYITLIIPFSIQSYTNAFNKSFLELLIVPEILITFIAFVLFFLNKKKLFKFDINILFIAIFASLLFYFLQAKGWSYHRVPIFSFVQFFCVILFLYILKNRLYLLIVIPIYIFALYIIPSVNPTYPALKKYIEKIPDNKTISIISMDIAQGVFLLKPSHIWASRYSAYFMFPSIFIDKNEYVKKITLKAINEDLLKYNPDIIIFQNKFFYDFLISNDLDTKNLFDNYYKNSYLNNYLILRK